MPTRLEPASNPPYLAVESARRERSGAQRASELPRVQPATSTALIGAGASRDAGFPIAYELLDELASLLISDRRSRTWVKHLAHYQRADRRTSNDFIRFEGFIDWALEIFGDADGLFSFIDLFDVPTSIDEALARAAAKGMHLLTVNFDDLLERAVDDAARQRAVTVDVHARARELPAESIPVVKLHGTRRMRSRGRSRRSGRPLQATIQRIAAGNPDFTLAGRQGVLFAQHVNDRDLVVVGYSGSDTIDIIPALTESSPSRVIWIDHQPEHKPRTLSLASTNLRHKPWREPLQALASSGVEVTVIAGQTTLALDAIGIPCQAPKPGPVPDWHEALKLWAEARRFHDPTGLGFAGLVLAEQGRYRQALAAFRKASPGKGAGANWTEPRRRYEIGQAYYLKTPTDLDEAEHWARRSLQANRGKNKDDDWRYLALTLLGRVAFIRYEYPRARRIFRSAATIAAHGSVNWANAVCWEGRVLTWAVEPHEALPLLVQADAVLSKSGDMQARLDVEEPLGIVYGWLGEYEKAEIHLTKAEHAAWVLGWETRIFGARQNIASCYLENDRYEDAITVAKDALREFPPPENEEAAEAMTVIADAKLELGGLREAEEWFRRALAAESVIGQGSHGWRTARLAEIALLRGDRQQARRRARAALRLRDAKRTPSSSAVAASVLCALGELSAAEMRRFIRRASESLPPTKREELNRILDRLGLARASTQRAVGGGYPASTKREN